MKLYTYDMAPNPARLKMFMAYKGIEVETEQIDMTKLEQRSERFLAINPEGTLPTLVLEDGTVLTAVVAMQHYLEELYPERPLLGTTAAQKAAVLNSCHQLFHSLIGAVAEVFRNTHPAFEDRGLPGNAPVPQIPALAERGRKRLSEEFVRLNQLLTDRSYIAGDFLSTADIDALAGIEFARWGARMEPDESLSALIEWRDRAGKALQAD
jgi:glutathione S-transferase